MTPTDEQHSICTTARNATANCEVRAYAGTGKTSTIVLAADSMREATLALAFNKSIASELAKRLPANFDSKTMNGLGHSVLTRALPKLRLDERKQSRIVSATAKALRVELSNDEWMLARQMLSRAQARGLRESDSFDDIADECWIPADSREMLIEIAAEALAAANAETRAGVISFDDQIYAPTILGIGTFPRYQSVVIDEAQDLSPLQHKMLALASTSARLIVVGDPKQAIYAFRGADSASMSKMQALRQEWTQHPLTMTFRCPKAIVARQQTHAPGYRAAEGNRDGRFLSFTKAWSWHEAADFSPTNSIAVLCRNNAPLLSLAFKLLRQRIACSVAGRDIGANLKSLIKQLVGKDECLSAETLALRLRDWAEREISLALANNREHLLAAIEDRSESLRAIIEGAQARDSRDALVAIDALFESKSGGVLLSSIHRAKGLEWDTVVHLDPHRLPAKQALRAAAFGDPGPLEQERNLAYVCETRTKCTLIEAKLKQFQ